MKMSNQVIQKVNIYLNNSNDYFVCLINDDSSNVSITLYDIFYNKKDILVLDVIDGDLGNVKFKTYIPFHSINYIKLSESYVNDDTQRTNVIHGI